MLAVLVVAMLLVGNAASARADIGQADTATNPGHRQPVDGEVVRGFEAPADPYGPGHRGIDLRAEPGAAVRASADGVVTHAGPVAGTGWVVIEHADGVATSYGPLDRIAVGASQRVDGGQLIGVVDDDPGHPNLHWGARRDGRYVDPRLLSEHQQLPSLVARGQWRGDAHVVEPYERWQGAGRLRLTLSPSPTARRAGYAVAPSPNHLVTINGLATDSQVMPFDPEDLGYDLSGVTALSYAGRHDDGPLDAHDPRRDQIPYEPSDTWSGVVDGAHRLADQLRAIRSREPGRAVDLVGHSMGGVVALYYLTHLHDPYDVTLPPVGNVVTIASPHRGSDLAETATWLRSATATRAGAEALLAALPSDGGRQIDETPLDMAALDQLATGSELLGDHGRAWEDAVAAGTAGALATGTRVMTIAGAQDLVATPHRTAHPTTGDVRTSGDAATHVVLPGGHESVKDTEAVRQVVWDFLHGRDVDHAPSVLASTFVDDAGLVLRLAGRAAALTSGPAVDLSSVR